MLSLINYFANVSVDFQFSKWNMSKFHVPIVSLTENETNKSRHRILHNRFHKENYKVVVVVVHFSKEILAKR